MPNTSEVNLTITIEHEERLEADADGIANEVARHIAAELGLAPGRAVVIEGRHHICGPVDVYLRSAFIVNPGDGMRVTPA